MQSRAREIRPFLLLCVIWGTTWIAAKASLESLPPLFLAGSRFTVAGAILLVPSILSRQWPVARTDFLRLLAAALLLIVLCYGALFWGMVYTDSGTSAVIEMGLTPVALLGFALAMGEEAFSYRKVAAIALGLCGLLLLFGTTAWQAWTQDHQGATLRILGALAVASAALTYGLGSVISRPLLRRYSATAVSGATIFLGGLILLPLSRLIEPGFTAATRLDWGVKTWSGWLFLVIFGSLVGYLIFMRLLRDLGASQAGMYAFVSPPIAVALGAVLRGERLGGLEVCGIVFLLAAAWLAMKDRSQPEYV
ncbi:DMT family transporter [Sphingomonas sp. MMS12-HWE2-04]|uniref:DMT family transporter n=1 Tax=Sphingomonas sp. MMS12-HWE2-04 TaxID=3234199 RepID=UPI00384CF726